MIHRGDTLAVQRIFDLWLACWTQDEIAAEVGCTVQPVKDVIADFSAGLPKNLKPAAEHATDFAVPIYNIWKQQTKSEGSDCVLSDLKGSQPADG